LISGTSFTTPRGENRRTWTYRIQPSVVHRPYARIDNGLIRSAPFNDVDATPTQLRWSPIPIQKKPTDFIEGMVTMGGNGDVATQVGMCVHVYAANRSMTALLLQCRDHGLSLEGAAGPEGPHHQPRAHVPETASDGVAKSKSGSLRCALCRLLAHGNRPVSRYHGC
jgi:homogentisate 1,2-dioxygenase